MDAPVCERSHSIQDGHQQKAILTVCAIEISTETEELHQLSPVETISQNIRAEET